jgi:type IV secretory pathway VirB2 component (pilin)
MKDFFDKLSRGVVNLVIELLTIAVVAGIVSLFRLYIGWLNFHMFIVGVFIVWGCNSIHQYCYSRQKSIRFGYNARSYRM